MPYCPDIDFKAQMEKIIRAATEKWSANSNKEANQIQRLWKSLPVTGKVFSDGERELSLVHLHCLSQSGYNKSQNAPVAHEEYDLAINFFFLQGDGTKVWKHPGWLPEPVQKFF